uniref:Glycosyltransferase 2-like domain-containing protein n=1 Tax=viral metagenome TaxID=1070528 RepID=A0A6C0JH10_9ZZZZ
MISVLIPIYNGIEFINESVTSVLEQSFEDWELIIAINGHPENSKEYQLAKEYEDLSDKIRVLDFYNVTGKAETLNAMIPHCKYDYVAILDVDDIWHERKLEFQQVYIKEGYDVIGSQCIYFGNLEGIKPSIPLGNISDFDFTKVNPIINSSAIIKKGLCYWNENGIEDYDLWLRLRKEKKRFYNCESVLVQHRIHNRSAFNSRGHATKIAQILPQYASNPN